MDKSVTQTTVSIVIVNFNAGDLLLASVEAALDSNVNVHISIVDNASSDDSFQRLSNKYRTQPNISLIKNLQNLGFAAANNIALKHINNEFILLLNPDCLLQPNTLSNMLDAMQNHPEAGMAGCRILNPDGTEQRGGRRLLPDLPSSIVKAFNLKARAKTVKFDLHQQELPDKTVYVEAISGAFMLVRKSALDEVGLLDEGYFMHCEDLDWAKRFQLHGWKAIFVPDVSVTHYQGSCSKNTPVAVEWHKHRGMLRYYQKFLASSHSILINIPVYLGVYLRFLGKSIALFARKDRD